MMPIIGVAVFLLGMTGSVWLLLRTRRRHALGVITQIGWIFFSSVFWSFVSAIFIVGDRS